MNKKNIILGGFGILIIGLTVYNLYQISNIENYINPADNEKLEFHIKEIQRKLLKIKKEIQLLNNQVISNSEKIKNLNQLINLKMRVDRNNLIFSNELENALKKLIHLKIEFEKKNNYSNGFNKNNNLIQILPKNLVLDNKNKSKKQNKNKNKKIVKIHIQPPTILLAKKLNSINGQYYLYLTDGTILTKGSIFQDVFKIQCINPNANTVMMKNINKYSYEYGKTYQIPFKIIFPVNESPVTKQDTTQNNNVPINLQ